MRVTSKMLHRMVDAINSAADLGDKTTPGALVLAQNDSGYQLQMVCNYHGAVAETVRAQSGYMPAREMYSRLRGYYEALHIQAEVECCKRMAEQADIDVGELIKDGYA